MNRMLLLTRFRRAIPYAHLFSNEELQYNGTNLKCYITGKRRQRFEKTTNGCEAPHGITFVYTMTTGSAHTSSRARHHDPYLSACSVSLWGAFLHLSACVCTATRQSSNLAQCYHWQPSKYYYRTSRTPRLNSEQILSHIDLVSTVIYGSTPWTASITVLTKQSSSPDLWQYSHFQPIPNGCLAPSYQHRGTLSAQVPAIVIATDSARGEILYFRFGLYCQSPGYHLIQLRIFQQPNEPRISTHVSSYPD
ncbi:hypothetical protein F4604DRAFT_1795070 [Suillus subluteus]|nr:hypothetical protein F4604DRAFT_1795070 [Suillus subluteus]